MELHLKIAGLLFLILALVHLIFPRYFNWTQELAHISLVNRQIMYVHTFFVAFAVFLMGVLCLVSAPELNNTILGKRVCLGIGIFWIARLLIQFFGYSSELWKGKRKETLIHIAFILLWLYFSLVFSWVYFR